jgi:hypothetical protein
VYFGCLCGHPAAGLTGSRHRRRPRAVHCAWGTHDQQPHQSRARSAQPTLDTSHAGGDATLAATSTSCEEHAAGGH